MSAGEKSMERLITATAAAALAITAVNASTESVAGGAKTESVSYGIKVFPPEGSKWKTENRNPASESEQKPAIIYASWIKSAPQPRVLVFTPEAWRDGRIQTASGSERITDGARYNYLLQFFYANTRDESRKGNRHIACYTGTPQSVIEQLFAGAPIKAEPGTDGAVSVSVSPANSIRYLVGDLEFSYSTDGFMMGIEGEAKQVNRDGTEKLVNFHFRLPSCDLPGKSNEIDRSLLDRKPSSTATVFPAAPTVSFDTFAQDASRFLPGREPAQAGGNSMLQGFVNTDPMPASAVKSLPTFQLRADFENATFDESKDRPWKGMDITTLRGAENFSILMLDYFMDGMVNQDRRRPDFNSIAENNPVRYWCHMPWMNQGPAGREAVHGMTRERPLVPSKMYPNATSGTNWGVSYYNGAGCKALTDVFGPSSERRSSMMLQKKAFPDGTNGIFPDGTAVVKILFTSASFPDLKGAFSWKGNISTVVGSNSRSINDVRLVQIDIAVRDSTIKGARKDLDFWVMTSYYYDGKYWSKYKTPGIPSGWGKMRPQGVQPGLGTPAGGDTIMLAGALSNGVDGRLNGPADNPASSCMSCHATAGVPGVGMVPGFLADSQYVANRGPALDFSQQLAMARRNFETKPKNNKRR